jgi:aminoglycoside phosphotransferase (APT) family kinase protein
MHAAGGDFSRVLSFCPFGIAEQEGLSMTTSQPWTQFAQLAQRVEPGSTLLRAWDMPGGVSARVTALEVARPDGSTRKLITRQHGAVDLQQNPQIAADEFRLLGLLRAAGVAAPTPYDVDQSGEMVSTPCIVMEYVEGETVFALDAVPDLTSQLAAQLARIHQIDGTRADVSFLPQQAQRVARLLGERPTPGGPSEDEERLRATLEAAWPWPQRNRAALLHGDFWPGNILWRGEKLAAVVDWEDAALGDPLADMANSRLELLWAFGAEAMRRFTREYQALHALDWANLPLWDMWAALRPIGKMDAWDDNDHARQTRHERHRWFIAQAYEALGK